MLGKNQLLSYYGCRFFLDEAPLYGIYKDQLQWVIEWDIGKEIDRMRSHTLFSGTTFIEHTVLGQPSGATVHYSPSAQVLKQAEDMGSNDRFQYVYTGQGDLAEHVDRELHKELQEENYQAWYTPKEAGAEDGVNLFKPNGIDDYMDANKERLQVVSTRYPVPPHIQARASQADPESVAFAGLSASLASHRFQGLFA
jgi:hypothetical protein